MVIIDKKWDSGPFSRGFSGPRRRTAGKNSGRRLTFRPGSGIVSARLENTNQTEDGPPRPFVSGNRLAKSNYSGDVRGGTAVPEQRRISFFPSFAPHGVPSMRGPFLQTGKRAKIIIEQPGKTCHNRTNRTRRGDGPAEPGPSRTRNDTKVV